MANKGTLNRNALNASAGGGYIQAEADWESVVSAQPSSTPDNVWRLLGGKLQADNTPQGTPGGTGSIVSLTGYQWTWHQASVGGPGHIAGNAEANLTFSSPPGIKKYANSLSWKSPSFTVSFTADPNRAATTNWEVELGIEFTPEPEIGRAAWEAECLSSTSSFNATRIKLANNTTWNAYGLSPYNISNSLYVATFTSTLQHAIGTDWNNGDDYNLYLSPHLSNSDINYHSAGMLWASASSATITPNTEFSFIFDWYGKTWKAKASIHAEPTVTRYVGFHRNIINAGVNFNSVGTFSTALGVAKITYFAKVNALSTARLSYFSTVGASKTVHSDRLVGGATSSAALTGSILYSPRTAFKAKLSFYGDLTKVPHGIKTYDAGTLWSSMAVGATGSLWGSNGGSSVLKQASVAMSAGVNHLHMGETTTVLPRTFHEVGLRIKGKLIQPSVWDPQVLIRPFSMSAVAVSSLLPAKVNKTGNLHTNLNTTISFGATGLINVIGKVNWNDPTSTWAVTKAQYSIQFPLLATVSISGLNRTNITARRWTNLRFDGAGTIDDVVGHAIYGGRLNPKASSIIESNPTVMVPANADWAIEMVSETKGDRILGAKIEAKGIGVKANMPALASKQPAGYGRRYSVAVVSRIFKVGK